MSKELTTHTQLRGQLSSMAPEFSRVLPSHITAEKFQRVVMTVAQQNPGLMTADRKSLMASCLKCAADGLVPDGREAALVLFGQQVQYMPMFTGILRRIRNTGIVSKIESHVIYENDEFIWSQGIDSHIHHKPLFPGDRGKPIGAYAIAKFNDGSEPQFEVMDFDQIEKVRAVSRSKNNGPWVQWWGEQARKTVFKRLAKWLPLNAEIDSIIEHDNEAERPEPIEPEKPIALEAKKASKLDAIVQEEPEPQQEDPKEVPSNPPQSDEDF